MRTPHPEGPCQGKLERGGFCFAALCEEKKEKEIQIISWAGAIWHAVITALSETSLTSLKEKIFYHKTRAPFKNSLQKSHKLIRLFNYTLLPPLSANLSSLAPSEAVLTLIRDFHCAFFFFSSFYIPVTIPHLLFTSSLPFSTCRYFVLWRTIFPLPPFGSIYHSLLCIFLQTNKFACRLAVTVSPLYGWPTCVLREVMLFDHNSAFYLSAACQQLLLEPEMATIGCTITERLHISNQIHGRRERVLFIPQSGLADEEKGFYLQIRAIVCVLVFSQPQVYR